MHRLLILNYAMDETDPIFPHQIDVVRHLAGHINEIWVLTTSFKPPKIALPLNIRIEVIAWEKGSPVKNFYHTLFAFLRVVFRFCPTKVFSHMTEVQSSIIAPFAKLLNIQHYLWYAHKSRSKFLLWNSWWVDKIFTSTRASCPISSSKVIALGQSINETIFPIPISRSYDKTLRWLSVGRIDPSKKIDWLLRIFADFQLINPNASLRIIGESSFGNEIYFADLKNLVKLMQLSNVEFLGKLSQGEISSWLNKSDLVVHAFQGSLDKVLVEASMSGIPIVTCNQEYLEEFGARTERLEFQSDFDLLRSELNAFLLSSPHDRDSRSSASRRIALERHSLGQWIERFLHELW